MTIQDLTNKYRRKIDFLDMEILIAHSLGKTREFVLMYPEYEIPSLQIKKLQLKISRRMRGEPIAYILKHKEFYGLDFIVNKDTLVPRPETEQLIDLTINEISNFQPASPAGRFPISNLSIIDIGTGSGCIINSIAHELENNISSLTKNLDSRLRGNDKVKYFGIDISEGALKIAKKNAKVHGVDKKIKFLHGNLLEPAFETLKCSMLHVPCSIIITANLPYLSKEIYNSAPVDVKKFEPKSALYSPEFGLQHYRKLLEQIKSLLITNDELQITAFFEISPEQKTLLTKIIKITLPFAEIEFNKDLAGKWRVCKITINPLSS